MVGITVPDERSAKSDGRTPLYPSLFQPSELFPQKDAKSRVIGCNCSEDGSETAESSPTSLFGLALS